MAKKTRKTSRKITPQVEPESLPLPDVDGDTVKKSNRRKKVDIAAEKTVLPETESTIVKKDPVLETLKKIERNTEDTKKILKDGAKVSKDTKKRTKTEKEQEDTEEDEKTKRIKKAEEIEASSLGDLFKKNVRKSIGSFGKRVRKGVARLPEDLAERTIPGPLGRVLSRTFKQKRIARDVLKKRDEEKAKMAAKPVEDAQTEVGSEIYKNPPEVDFTTGADTDTGPRREEVVKEDAGDTVAAKLDSIFEEGRKTNQKLDKLVDFARGNNEIQEQQNALLEESQTESERKTDRAVKANIQKEKPSVDGQQEGGGGLLDLFDLFGSRDRRGRMGLGRRFGRSRIGRMLRVGKIGLSRRINSMRGGLFKDVGKRSPILRGLKSLMPAVATGGGVAAMEKAVTGQTSPSPSGAKSATGQTAQTAQKAPKEGFFSRMGSKLKGAAQYVGKKVSNLGLGKVVDMLKTGSKKFLPKLIKLPLVGAAIETALMSIDVSAIKSDPKISAKEKKKRIGERVARGVGSAIGSSIGAMGGAAVAGTLGLATGPGALIIGALGALAGGVAGSYIGDKLGMALAEGVGGEELYNILHSIPLVGRLIAVPEDQNLDPTKSAQGTGNDKVSQIVPSSSSEGEVKPSIPSEPAQVAPSSAGNLSLTAQNMVKTNDAIDAASNVTPQKTEERKNLVVSAPTNNTTMMAPLNPRNRSLEIMSSAGRQGIAFG